MAGVVVDFSVKAADFVDGVKKVNITLEETTAKVAEVDESLTKLNSKSIQTGKQIQNFGQAFEALKGTWQNTTGALNKFSATASAARGVIFALTGGLNSLKYAIAGVTGVFGMIFSAISAAVSIFSTLNQSVDESAKKMDAAEKSADNYKRRIEELAQAMGKFYNKDLFYLKPSEAAAQQKAEEDRNSYLEHGAKLYTDLIKLQQDYHSKVVINADVEKKAIEDNAWGLKKLHDDMFKALAEDRDEEALHLQYQIDTYLRLARHTRGYHDSELESIKKKIIAQKQLLEQFDESIDKRNAILRIIKKINEVEKKPTGGGRRKESAAERYAKEEQEDEAYLNRLLKRWHETYYKLHKYTHEQLADVRTSDMEVDAMRRLKHESSVQKALVLIEKIGRAERRIGAEKDWQESMKRISKVQQTAEAAFRKIEEKPKVYGLFDSPIGEETEKINDKYQNILDQNKKIQEELRQALFEFYQLSDQEQLYAYETEEELQEKLAAAEKERYSQKRKYLLEYSDARKKDYAQQIHDMIALSKYSKEAVDADVKGMQELAAGLKEWGADADIVQAIEMNASGIKAGADAIDYAAQASKAYAMGNIPQGIGLSAAAAGKALAAAAYAKGLTKLGHSNNVEEPNISKASSSANSGSSVGSLTGELSQHQTIDINMMYSWGDSKLAQYLIQGLNATASTPGTVKINPQIIARS